MVRPLDVALAVLVAVTWGLAFVCSKLALQTFSAPQLVALRFLVMAAPALVLARPNVPWRVLILVGLTLFAGQFLFQFIGIAWGMPAGLASVIVQAQALFTVAFMAALGEQPTRRQLAGMAAACVGLLILAASVGQGLTLAAFALTLVSPISFAIGNILLKQAAGPAGKVEMVNLVTWLSLVPPIPMLALSLVTDGPAALPQALLRSTWMDLGMVLYLGLVSGTLGYAIWSSLLQRYSAAQVTPFALLVPFFAAASSWLLLGEQFGPLRLAGMAWVVAGLAIIVLPSRRG